MFPVSMAPQKIPDEITLQASATTWLRVAAHLKRNKLAGVARLIERQVSADADSESTVRLSFPDAQARSILRSIGLSA